MYFYFFIIKFNVSILTNCIQYNLLSIGYENIILDDDK